MSMPAKNLTPTVTTGPLILVNGAGVAGLTVAWQLYRHGFRVTLAERAVTVGALPAACWRRGASGKARKNRC